MASGSALLQSMMWMKKILEELGGPMSATKQQQRGCFIKRSKQHSHC